MASTRTEMSRFALSRDFRHIDPRAAKSCYMNEFPRAALHSTVSPLAKSASGRARIGLPQLQSLFECRFSVTKRIRMPQPIQC